MLLVIFLLTAVISFAGSLQVGPVNYFVVKSAIQVNSRSGVMVAIGGSIPELIYSLLAVLTGAYLHRFPGIFSGFQLISAVVMGIIGCVIFFRPFSQPEWKNDQSGTVSGKRFLLKGFMLGMLNPQLLPFWLVVYTSFFSLTGFKIVSLTDNIAFIAGTGIGAFALHLLLIRLTETNRSRLSKWMQVPGLHRIIGSIFVILAMIQVISL